MKSVVIALYCFGVLAVALVILDRDGAFTANYRVGWPTIALNSGTLPIALPVAPDAVETGLVKAGAQNKLCYGNTQLVPEVPVQAILCARNGRDCIAVVDIREADFTAVAALDQAPVLRDMEKNCE